MMIMYAAVGEGGTSMCAIGVMARFGGVDSRVWTDSGRTRVKAV
jgi:hypothetical protein